MANFFPGAQRRKKPTKFFLYNLTETSKYLRYQHLFFQILYVDDPSCKRFSVRAQQISWPRRPSLWGEAPAHPSPTPADPPPPPPVAPRPSTARQGGNAGVLPSHPGPHFISHLFPPNPDPDGCGKLARDFFPSIRRPGEKMAPLDFPEFPPFNPLASRNLARGSCHQTTNPPKQLATWPSFWTAIWTLQGCPTTRTLFLCWVEKRLRQGWPMI